MASDGDFWRRLDRLVNSCKLKIDRPQGSSDAGHAGLVYPYDYGYLEGTQAGDGAGIDVWVGSLPARTVTAVVCTVDMKKRDAEVKILVGCTPQEAQEILKVHNYGLQSAILVERT